MKLDVSDSMFMLSSVNGADLEGGPHSSAPHHKQVPLLPHPTLVSLTYTDEPSEDGTPWTRLEVAHDHLPTHWAPLMQSVWKARMSGLPAWALRW